MHFSELLVSLALFAILSVATAGVYTRYAKNVEKTFKTTNTAVRMLAADKKIREAVSNITIPYWEDENEYAAFQKAILLQQFALDTEIHIEKIDMMRNSGGGVCGYKVTWTFFGKECVTECLFASVPIIGGK